MYYPTKCTVNGDHCLTCVGVLINTVRNFGTSFSFGDSSEILGASVWHHARLMNFCLFEHLKLKIKMYPESGSSDIWKISKANVR